MADAVERIEVDREQDAGCDQEQLGLLVDAEPEDHQRITARCGMLRSICSEESSSRSANGNAVEQSQGEAQAAADGEADQARWVLIQTWCRRAPLRSVSQNASAVASAGGRAPTATWAVTQTRSRAIGRSQGTVGAEHAPHDADRARAYELVGDDLAEGAGVAHRPPRPARRRLERQQREDEPRRSGSTPRGAGSRRG